MIGMRAGRAVDHADLALGELLPQRGAVDRARVGLGVARRDHALEEGEGGDVGRAVDGVLAGRLVAAAVAEHPQQRFGLRLLVAEGEAEADVAQLGDLGGVGLDVGPGLRGGHDAGLREQLLVVEEGAAGSGERHAVLDAVVGALRLERGQQVRGVREHVRRRVQQAVLGVVGEVVALGDVRVVLVLDHRLDLRVEVGPGDRGDVHLDVGVRRLERGDDRGPVLGAGVAGAGAVVGDHELEGGRAAAAAGRRTAAAAAATAAGEGQRGRGSQRETASDATRELLVHQVSSLCHKQGRLGADLPGDVFVS